MLTIGHYWQAILLPAYGTMEYPKPTEMYIMYEPLRNVMPYLGWTFQNKSQILWFKNVTVSQDTDYIRAYIDKNYQWCLKAFWETSQSSEIAPTRVFLLSLSETKRKWSETVDY